MTTTRKRQGVAVRCVRGDVLLVDNYDSYTYNLAHLIASVHGRAPIVVRNDALAYGDIAAAARDGALGCVVLSPGPGTPARREDVGVCWELLEKGTNIPILGVCLGHQALAMVNGCSVRRAREPFHGRKSALVIAEKKGPPPLFRGIARGTEVVRYHSLEVDPTAIYEHRAPDIVVTAWANDGEDGHPETGSIMGIAHRTFPHHGVQFHPESIATEDGARIVANFLDIAKRHWERVDAWSTERHTDATLRIQNESLADHCVFRKERNADMAEAVQRESSVTIGGDDDVEKDMGVHIHVKKVDSVLDVVGRSSERIFKECIALENPESCFWLDSSSSDVPLPTPRATPSSERRRLTEGDSTIKGLDTRTERRPAVHAAQASTSSRRTGESAHNERIQRNMPARSRFSYMGSKGGSMWRRVSFKLDAPGASLDRRGNSTGVLTIEDRDGEKTEQHGSLFDFLDSEMCRLEAIVDTNAVPREGLPFDFWGGYVGYLGYELKAECDGANAHASNLPDAVFYLADRFAVIDHDDGSVYFVALNANASAAAVAVDGTTTSPTSASSSWDWIREMETRLRRIEWEDDDSVFGEMQPANGSNASAHGTHSSAVSARQPRDKYLSSIHACKNAILDGDSYELCLTNSLTLREANNAATSSARTSAADYYSSLRRINPAPYSAFFRSTFSRPSSSEPRVLSVCCSSPERFLKLDRNGTIEAKPIKGTVRRESDPERDATARASLRSSKEYAENLMIVDLLRNDLARVCELGSVAVPKLMQIETYANVHQLVSTVTGTRVDGVSAVRCVKAAFPGGSMTGAPKIRSMRILDAIEAGPRGVYSGSLGFFSVNGTVDLNIVIRTAVFEEQQEEEQNDNVVDDDGAAIAESEGSKDGSTIYIGAGGAITYLSNAQAELDEVMLKAEPLLIAAMMYGAAPTCDDDGYPSKEAGMHNGQKGVIEMQSEVAAQSTTTTTC